MLAASVAITAYAEDSKYGDYLSYAISNEEVTITLCDSAAVTIAIPKNIENAPVKTIADSAFSACESLTDVHYEGTEEEWNGITIGTGNEKLENATFHYSSTGETENKDFENITFEDKFFEYDGDEKELLISGELPEGANVSYKYNKTSYPGVYTATAVITMEGYNTLTLNAELKIGYVINEKQLPLKGYEPEKEGDAETFAKNVYKEIWSSEDGENLIRSVEKENRAINEKNARSFILSSELGANICLTNGEEGENEKTYSFILVSKDAEEFTAYCVINEEIWFPKNPYEEFAGIFEDYKYFDSVTFPNAPEYTKAPQVITVEDFGEVTYGDADVEIKVTKDKLSKLENFTYTSDNENVATITEEGKIKIVGAGKAIISVTEAGNDEYAETTVKKELTVNKKAVTVNSINLENKTAELSGVLEADKEAVALDFDKINVETGDAVAEDEESVNVSLKNLVLKGDKSANYEITDESFATTMKRADVIDVKFSEAENGTATGNAKYIKGSNVTVTATADSGYEFKGWYNGDTLISSDESYTFTADSDIELTAKFEKIRVVGIGGGSGASSTCTVKFDTNGGSKIANVKVNRNKTVSKPANPEKEGYVFDGWYTDKGLTKAYDFSEKVSKGFTLYAKWVETTEDNTIVLTIGSKKASVFGEEVENDVAPIIRNDRTMLPIRFIAEALGADVEWDNDTRTVTVSADDIEIVITIDSDTAVVNGESVKLDSPAFIENDRTYLPIRFISENLGAKVEWNEETKTVTITK